MEWSTFKESSKDYPEVIVEKAIAGFANATNNLAELAITPKSDFAILTSKLMSKFQFDLELFSKHLEGYSFKVLELGYDIELFPVKLAIETSIIAELNKTYGGYAKIVGIDTEENFKNVLELIFKTERFTEIVAGLMKIARKNEDTF